MQDNQFGGHPPPVPGKEETEAGLHTPQYPMQMPGFPAEPPPHPQYYPMPVPAQTSPPQSNYGSEAPLHPQEYAQQQQHYEYSNYNQPQYLPEQQQQQHFGYPSADQSQYYPQQQPQYQQPQYQQAAPSVDRIRQLDNVPTKQGAGCLPPKVERFLCCCCPKNKKHRMICGGAVFLVLIVAGVLLYFFLPRMPEIKVYNIDFSTIGQTGSAYSFSYTNATNPGLNNLRFTLNLTMNLGTKNPNPYDLSVEHIDLVAQLMVNQSVVFSPFSSKLTSFNSLVQIVGPAPTPPRGYYPSNSSQIGTSSYGSIVFTAKATVNYTMLFLLDYTPDQFVGILNDPTAMEIASVCGITGKRRPMVIHYDAKSTIPALKPIGFSPVLSNDVKINCPFSDGQIQAVIQACQNGMDVMDALHQVFGGGSQSLPAPGLNPVVSVPDPNNAGVAAETSDAGAAQASPTVAPTNEATGGNVVTTATARVRTVVTGATAATSDTLSPTGDVLATTIDLQIPEQTTTRRNGGGGQLSAVPTL
ncbi:hypothetical protein HDU98_009459 [Podochytrium sp. JEL0797]|nr:hypothetical protein HDU98_009459 [Podochytrium sp. JEL0797]